MHTNRLAREKSPYLLQHAHNPVDWFPWGEEAFAKAAAENKPIFLSIGYSTCHWCHVMERESFETESVADVLNRSFVSIKVDREERPDVDSVYMAFVQGTTGGGGWPMSVFLTPDRKPFFGGTYFPPDSQYGRPGFRALLDHIANTWIKDRDRIVASSESILDQLRRHAEVQAADEPLDPAALDQVFLAFRRMFDPRLGGFGGAPKFPRPVVHNFLLRYYRLTGKTEALDMVLLTLREMAKGGMHDQIGGGFHRYSVDDRWFVSHFEKMLYDQAQLAISYLEAYQITGDEALAAVARDVFEYVLRDMTGPGGGFYSADDADSAIDSAHPEEKGEGAFYIWSYAELSSEIERPALDWFCYAYGVVEDGNVVEDPHGEFANKNILFVCHSPEDTAERFGVALSRVKEALAVARVRLLEARSCRIRPHLDDKILTAWNGLMISAVAKGAQVLDEPLYRDAALKAAQFVLKHLYRPDSGTLLRRFRDGEGAIDGFLDDYAFFTQALLDVYETVFDPYYLDVAAQLAHTMIERFEDPDAGGFFSTAAGDASLVLRMKDDYDGAEPSGNSVAADALLRLSRLTDRQEFGRPAERALLAFGSRIASAGTGIPQMLCALLRAIHPAQQVVIAGPREDPGTAALLRVARRRFLPESGVMLVDGDEARRELARFSPALGAMGPVNGRPAAYVCENFACRLPVTEAEKLSELLQ